MIHGRFVSEQRELIIAEEIYRRANILQGESECGKVDSGTLVHALVYEGADDSCPAAAGCILFQPDNTRLLRVAVLSEYRGKAYGEFLVRMLIDKAETGGAEHIKITCKKEISSYFSKLGFVASDKEITLDKNEGVNMIYKTNSRTCCAKLM